MKSKPQKKTPVWYSIVRVAGFFQLLSLLLIPQEFVYMNIIVWKLTFQVSFLVLIGGLALGIAARVARHKAVQSSKTTDSEVSSKPSQA